jgi:hypothetical protein
VLEDYIIHYHMGPPTLLTCEHLMTIQMRSRSRFLKRYIAREIYKALCRPRQPATASAPHVKQDLPAPVLT